MSTARSSVVTSSRTSLYFSGEPGGKLAHCGLREKHRRAHPQPAARRLAARRDRRRGLVDFGQQHRGSLVEGATFLGELQRARAALEQAQVEPAFQVGDPPRQRRLGPPRFTGSAPEAAVARHEVEVGKCEEVHVFQQ
jgi:hypothetical protein